MIYRISMGDGDYYLVQVIYDDINNSRALLPPPSILLPIYLGDAPKTFTTTYHS